MNNSTDDDWMLEHKRMDIERKRLAELDEVVRENNALKEQRDFLIKKNENLQLKIEEVQQLEQTQRFLLQISDAYKSGREEERVAIVAWMRQRHADLGQLAAKLCGRHPDGWLAGQVFFAGRTADAIEALELGEVTMSKHEKNMTDKDIVDLVEYTHKVQKAAAKSERTAITKWLNNNERYFPDWWISGDYAQAIELGEYLQDDEHEIVGE